jgi:hypothetical protein
MPLPPPSVSDDGDPATRWDQTFIKQEFYDIYRRFAKWQQENKSDFPSKDFETLVRIADMVLGEIDESMTGKL